MRVLLAHFPVVASGGAERSTIDLGSSLNLLGHTVYLWGPWSCCQTLVSVAERNGLRIIEQTSTSYIAEIFKIRETCKELGIDIIISSSRRYNIIGHIATWHMPTRNIPVLRGPLSTWDVFRRTNQLHSFFLPAVRSFWLTILRKAPIIICVSEAVAKDARKLLSCKPSQTAVIYNAIGVTTGSGNGITNAHHKERTAFRIILVGRMSPEKRPERIVPLMQEILRHDKDISAYVIGDGECKGELIRLVRDSGLDANIKILGHCDDVTKWYERSHILVHFRNDEGFGRIYLEAQMNSLPVVCVRGGAANEVVCDGVTGYLHDLNDICGMAQSIIKLKNNKSKYCEMSQSASRWAKNEFSLSTMAKQYETIAHKVMKERIG